MNPRRARCLVWPLAAMLAVMVLPLVTFAQSAGYCVTQYRKGGKATSIAPEDAEKLVRDVAESIGIHRPITVFPCPYATKAMSWSDRDGTAGPRDAEYVIFNPIWVREVIGSDKIQAYAIFGHELGHLLNGDFGPNADLPEIEKETNADAFGGCAVARMGGSWSQLENLLSRLREEAPARDARNTPYPSRLVSLEAARKGFEKCGGHIAAKRALIEDTQPTSIAARWVSSPPTTYIPIPAICTCLAETRPVRPTPGPDQMPIPFPSGSLATFASSCPADVRVWVVRDSDVRGFNVPLNMPAFGRLFAYEIVKPSQTLVIDLSGAVGGWPTVEGCPPQYTSQQGPAAPAVLPLPQPQQFPR